MINSRMNVDMGIITTLPNLLLLLPPHMLLVIRKRHIEIESLISLRESQPNKRVLPAPILNFQNEIPRGIKNSLHRGLPRLTWQYKARGE